jgi:hypothetical protein
MRALFHVAPEKKSVLLNAILGQVQLDRQGAKRTRGQTLVGPASNTNLRS